jgi:hypothetical protein
VRAFLIHAAAATITTAAAVPFSAITLLNPHVDMWMAALAGLLVGLASTEIGQAWARRPWRKRPKYTRRTTRQSGGGVI